MVESTKIRYHTVYYPQIKPLQVVLDPKNIRVNFDVNDLATQIADVGLLQPPLVARDRENPDVFHAVFGHRRVLAGQLLEQGKIVAVDDNGAKVIKTLPENFAFRVIDKYYFDEISEDKTALDILRLMETDSTDHFGAEEIRGTIISLANYICETKLGETSLSTVLRKRSQRNILLNELCKKLPYGKNMITPHLYAVRRSGFLSLTKELSVEQQNALGTSLAATIERSGSLSQEEKLKALKQVATEIIKNPKIKQVASRHLFRAAVDLKCNQNLPIGECIHTIFSHPPDELDTKAVTLDLPKKFHIAFGCEAEKLKVGKSDALRIILTKWVVKEYPELFNPKELKKYGGLLSKYL